MSQTHPDDAPGTRSIRKEVELAADPDIVWQAIATGPGISCWFVPSEVEPREGGRIAQHFGPGMDVEGLVTGYEPGRRFAYGARGDHPGPSLAFEFLIEGRDGATTVLRLINSGFSTDAQWDAEYDGTNEGWDVFLSVLQTYVRHFPGQPAAVITAVAYAAGEPDAAWAQLLDGLAIDPGHATLHEGDAVSVGVPGGVPIRGVVDVTGPRILGLRGEDPPAVVRLMAEGAAGAVGISAYIYAYGDAGRTWVDADPKGWQDVLDQAFPAPAMPET